MTLQDFGHAIAKFAPSIGALLPLPGGAAIGAAIAAAFGGDANNLDDLVKRIELDPQSQVKLQEIQANLQIQMRQADSEDYKTEVDDRKSARERAIEAIKAGAKFDMTEVIGYLVIIGGFFMLAVYAITKTQESKEIVIGVFGLMQYVCQFLYGGQRTPTTTQK